ncbi:MAG: translocation/assembly module TamB domain-containing protein [Bacteroidales bacterium]
MTIPLCIYLAFQIPQVQTWTANQVIDSIEDKIDGTINIEKIYLVFFNRAIIQKASVVGYKDNDTLICFDKLSVNFVPTELLLRGRIKVNKLFIENGSFNLLGENDTDKTKTNLNRIFRIKKHPKKKNKSSFPKIIVSDLRLKNFNFRFLKRPKYYKSKDPSNVNFADIDVKNINIRLKKSTLEINGLKIESEIKQLTCIEKSGWKIDLKGDYYMNSKGFFLKKMTFKDNYSYINTDYISLSYNHISEMHNFLNKVNLGAKFNMSSLDFRTLGIIIPSLKDNSVKLTLDGEVSGPVNHLFTKRLKIISLDSKIILSADINNITKIKHANFDVNIFSLLTNCSDIANIIADFKGVNPNENLAKITPTSTYSYSGQFQGSLNDLLSTGYIDSDVGKIWHKVNLSITDYFTNISGSVYTTDVNLGEIINNKNLGKVTLQTNMSINIEKNKSPKFHIDSLKIDRFGYNDYDYSNIFAVGSYINNKFDGRIIVHDPNLDLIFQGLYSTNKSQDKKYDFFASVPYCDLHALNIDKRDKISKIKFITSTQINSRGKFLFGSVSLKDLSYKNSINTYDINSLLLTSNMNKGNFNLKLNAPFLQAQYSGKISPIAFVNSLMKDLLVPIGLKKQEIAKNDIPTTNLNKLKANSLGLFTLKTQDTRPLCALLYPNLYIADSTDINIELLKNDKIAIKLNSDRIAYGENYLKNLKISVNNPNKLRCYITSDETVLSGITLDNSHLLAIAEEGLIDLSLKYHNNSDNNSLNLSSIISFDKDKNQNTLTKIHINKSNMIIKDYDLVFHPSDIEIGNKYYSLSNFKISNGNQSFSAHGKLSKNRHDSLLIKLNDFDLSFIDSITDSINLKGHLNGNISLSDIFGTSNILAKISGKDIYICDEELGDLDINSYWNNDKNWINLELANNYHGKKPLYIKGYYKPNGKLLDLDVDLNELHLSYLKPFMENIITSNSGSLSGDIKVIGTLNKLNLRCNNGHFNKYNFTPVYTNVPYVLDGNFKISQRGVNFDNITITDRKNNVGVLSGDLFYTYFHNISFDTRLNFNKLEFINIEETENSSFYGNLYGSGEVNIKGGIKDLLMDIDFTTENSSNIHIPISTSSSATNQNLLTFQKHEVFEDKYEEMIALKKKAEKKKENKTKLELIGKATITPETILFIEIDKHLGNMMQCQGSGVIDFNISPNKGITDIRGDYSVQEGKYTFVLGGITSRNLTLNEGGKISFKGDIANTTMDVGATYSTKASVSTLIGDNSAVESRRDVNCGIKMKGALSNPEISFDIDIPDLDPITKAKAESALSSSDKVQKQFMALLISGSFVPDEQSGIVNNTTLLYSNAGEILSNQFNNVFRQLDIPLDLGLNYQPGESGQNNMFDVALSYQIFNNRVIINGNVGSSQKATEEVMGNIETQIKIDNKGKFRINIFSQAQDDYSNYLDNTQRTGFGFTYQDEFDNIGELFRNIFYSRKRLEAIEIKKLKEAKEELQRESHVVKQKVKLNSVNPIEYN